MKRELAGALLAVAVVFGASATLNAGLVMASQCMGGGEGSCGAITQGCAYGGIQNPVPCVYCSGDAKGSFCGWHPAKECNSTGDVECGKVYYGLCSLHFCSGGGGTQQACYAQGCTTEPIPPEQP